MSGGASWSDLDLLTLQRRWLVPIDSPPRRAEALLGVRVVGAVAGEGWRVLPGSTLPAVSLARVEQELAGERPGDAPPAALLDEVGAAAGDGGPARFEGGPVYLAASSPLGARAGAEVPAGSTPAEVSRLGHLAGVGADVALWTWGQRETPELASPRPSSWEPGEWQELLRGDLGPWAAAVSGGEVVSLAHTPKPLLPDAAECGVWTAPAFRGRRLAGAVTEEWSRLAAAPGRHLFYSTDHRNLPSQRVVASLSWRPLGWQWTVSAEPWPEGDAWGRALLDQLRGGWTPTPELETDDGAVGPAMHPDWFFRPFGDWDPWERELVSVAARGPALDLGAGAGRTSCWLQSRGVAVTAVDSSPGAVEVCRARGVGDVRLGDVNDPPDDKRWRAIFLMCGNLGLGGSHAATRRLLARLAEIAAPDAVLVGDTVQSDGPPDIGLRIRYRGQATPWWRQRNIPIAEMADLVDGTGWDIERHVLALPDHAVLLRRRGGPEP